VHQPERLLDAPLGGKPRPAAISIGLEQLEAEHGVEHALARIARKLVPSHSGAHYSSPAHGHL
jgi:hypothetical protein